MQNKKIKLDYSAVSKPKNLVLFIEDDGFYDVHHNLVRLYMNRFTIEEEQQFEIVRTFKLTNDSYKLYKEIYFKENLGELPYTFNTFSHEINMRERYKQILKKVFADLETLEESFTGTDTHIIIGIEWLGNDFDDGLNLDLDSYLNVDHFADSLENVIPLWIRNIGCDMEHPRNQLTLLCGYFRTDSDGFYTKDDVKNVYENREYFAFSNYKNKQLMSVNDDLEELFRQLTVEKPQDLRECVRTFQFKKLVDWDDEEECFERWDCERLTVSFD